MHAEGFAAGELKHGPIALIEDGLPVIVVMPSPKNAAMLHSQAAEQHPRDPGPRRGHHRHRRGGRRHGAALRRPPDRDPRGVNAFPAAAVDDPAAGVRRGGRAGARLRRRQAAQPGQVRHRRVDVDGLGHFRSDAARAHFLAAYRAGMAGLPPMAASFDVPTAFGTVRAYRFDGPADKTPVVLLPGRNASTPMWRRQPVHDPEDADGLLRGSAWGGWTFGADADRRGPRRSGAVAGRGAGGAGPDRRAPDGRRRSAAGRRPTMRSGGRVGWRH